MIHLEKLHTKEPVVWKSGKKKRCIANEGYIKRPYIKES